MAIAASSVTPTNSLEDFRIEFNNLVSDVSGLTATNKFDTAIIFEGATADAYETTLTVTDPTADRTITLPNETGTVFTSGGAIALGGSITKASDLTVDVEGDISLDANGGDIYLKDNGTIFATFSQNGGNLIIKNSSAEESAITIAGDEVVTFADDLIIKDGGTIGVTSATTAITIASTGNVTLSGDLITTGAIEPAGDTATGDNAAIGYTSAEGLILTGQGSTNDVTIKNDADGDVISIPTGTTNVTIAGDLTISGDDLYMGTNTSGAALIADGTNYNPVVISGDATIATNGALTIAATSVEGSMLNTNVISGQTALTTAVAATDELMISDAGTLKRVDVSLITALAAGDATALAIALG